MYHHVVFCDLMTVKYSTEDAAEHPHEFKKLPTIMPASKQQHYYGIRKINMILTSISIRRSTRKRREWIPCMRPLCSTPWRLRLDLHIRLYQEVPVTTSCYCRCLLVPALQRTPSSGTKWRSKSRQVSHVIWKLWSHANASPGVGPGSRLFLLSTTTSSPPLSRALIV